jgi:hypothetical protein
LFAIAGDFHRDLSADVNVAMRVAIVAGVRLL